MNKMVNNVDDIKNTIKDFCPNNKGSISHKISNIFDISDENGSHRHLVEANISSKTPRDIIIDGLDIIKNRTENVAYSPVEINGKTVQPIKMLNSIKSRIWVDKLIESWFGGYRDGLLICWNLNNKIYKYNIYTHELICQ